MRPRPEPCEPEGPTKGGLCIGSFLKKPTETKNGLSESADSEIAISRLGRRLLDTSTS